NACRRRIRKLQTKHKSLWSLNYLPAHAKHRQHEGHDLGQVLEQQRPIEARRKSCSLNIRRGRCFHHSVDRSSSGITRSSHHFVDREYVVEEVEQVLIRQDSLGKTYCSVVPLGRRECRDLLQDGN